jgi:hypothetical protein
LRSNIKIINFLGHGVAVTEKRPKALCAVAIFYFSFPRPLGARRAGISAAECKLAKGADCHSAQAPIANSKRIFTCVRNARELSAASFSDGSSSGATPKCVGLKTHSQSVRRPRGFPREECCMRIATKNEMNQLHNTHKLYTISGSSAPNELPIFSIILWPPGRATSSVIWQWGQRKVDIHFSTRQIILKLEMYEDCLTHESAKIKSNYFLQKVVLQTNIYIWYTYIYPLKIMHKPFFE